MDYSFYHTNQECVPLFPVQAMQFGQTLQRLLQNIVYADPQHGPPLLAKIDLADGYYRVPLSPQAVLTLAVVIPSDSHHHNLIAIPLTLPMDWAQSPPFFCAYTKTVVDLVNTHLTPYPEHPLLHRTQHPSLSLPTLKQSPSFNPAAVVLGPLTAPPPPSYCDVYINNFITVAQAPNHLITYRL
jgi:hypothetical protein